MKELSDRIAALTPEQRAVFEMLRKKSAPKKPAPAAPPPISRRAESGPAPLSFDQERLWFLYQLDPKSSAYNIDTAVRMKGPLDVAVLAAALNEIVRRHEAWRTVFPAVDGRPVQVALPGVTLRLPLVDLRELPEALREAVAREIAIEEGRQPFALERESLARACLVRLADDEHLCLLTVHHIVSDWLSFQIAWQELAALYPAFSEGRPSPLPEPPIQYADFAIWQRSWLQGETLERQLEFWVKELQGFPHELELPTDHPRPPVQTTRGAKATVALPPGIAEPFRALARREGVTPFMAALAVLNAVLFRWSGQERILVGSPNANRNRQELQGLLGFFLTQTVFATDLEGDPTFRELLKRERRTALDAYAHQELPFGKLVEALRPERDPSRAPLVQVSFQVLAAEHTVLELPTLRISEVLLDEVTSTYDLNVTLWDGSHGLDGWFEYNLDLFDPPTLARMTEAFERVAEQVGRDPDVRLSELAVMREGTRQQLLLEWGTSPALATPEESLVGLFEARAAETPGAVAVVSPGESLTYEELRARALRLAHHLREMGVGPDVLVGLCVERSPEMVVGILGILAAGGAYVPLDPSYPRERLAFLAEDAGIEVLLTRGELEPGAFAGEPAASPLPEIPEIPESLAYVIYTSGTTGRPKGVMVSRRGLSSYLGWALRAYPAGRGSLLHSSISFDLTVTSLFVPLLRGERVVLVPEAESIEGLASALAAEEGLSFVKLTPSHARALGQRLAAGDLAGRTRALILGGEALKGEDLAPWREAAPETLIFNEYGPTETVVGCSLYGAPAGALAAGPVPIGRPAAGARLQVLDRALEPVPPGASGELYIGGPGVARGYLARPQVTAERFLPDPFGGRGDRMYRTGDLARFRADGTLEFLGRADDQVKVRGYRIEPGEIEAVLAEHPAVREAAVLVREVGEGGRQLVAWVVPEPGESPGEETLRGFLAGRLPVYMVPTAILSTPELPLSPNGKVDRRALARMEVAPADDLEPTAPRTPAEEVLAEIWRGLLGVERVGVHENFFRLGGDSILGIQVVARARQAGWVITPQQIFEHQTIAGLAAVAVPPEGKEERGEVLGEAPLTPIQQRLFAELADVPEALHHYNQAVLLEARGELDPGPAARAFEALAVHHDALRLRFAPSGAVHAPAGEAAASFPFSRIDLSGLPEEPLGRALAEAADQAHTGLDADRGPLARAVLFGRGPGRSARLLLIVHHLVVDGVSWRILLEDLETAWRQLAAGGEVRLPAKTTSWKRWAEGLAGHARSAETREELGYWLSLPVAEVRPLPVDREAAGAGTVGSRESVSVALPAGATAALLKEAPRAYRTQVNDLLLTALAQAFARFSGEERLRIDLEGHGREDVVPGADLSRTVGWFTTLFPVVLDLTGARGPGEAILRVKEHLRGIPRRGLGFGLLRWLAGGEAAERLAALPAAEVSFNYLGQLDAAIGQDARLVPAPEPSGLNVSPRAPRWYRLEVDAMVLGDQLRVDWGYSRELYDRATVERLARGFVEALEALTAHCLSPEAGGFSPSDFPLARLDQATLDAVLGADRSVEDVYPLAPLQQGMLFHTLYSPGSELYFEQMTATLAGRLDVPAFARAWQEVVDRQPILRTAFAWGGLAEPLQIVRRGVCLPWRLEDWRGEAGVEARWRELLAADRARGFDPARPPLLRLTLVRTGEGEHRLVWSFHHVLLDGWCLSLVFREVLTLYAAHRQGGETAVLLEPVRPYRDYIAWLGRQDPEKAESYWRAELAGFTAPTPIPFDHPEEPAAGRAEDFREVGSVLPEPAAAALAAAARARGLTLNTLTQGAWALLLSRYGGGRDVVFGGVVSGRPADLPGVESMIGLFINTLPMRVDVDPEAAAGPWLLALQERQVRQREVEWSPLSEIQRWSGLPPGEALFESLLVFENYPVDRSLGERLTDFDVRDLTVSERSNYPLTLVAASRGELELRLSFDRRFEAVTAGRMLAHLETLLAGLSEGADRPLADLPLLSAAERQQLFEWSGAAVEDREAVRVDRLLALQAARTPGAAAITAGGRTLTHGELDRRAGRLARRLASLGIGPEARVGLRAGRSPELVVGLLGIWKAGAAYVPLDPDLPQERLALLIEDAGIGVVVADEAARPGLPPEVHVVPLEGLEESDGEPREEPVSRTAPGDLAYVIYTSGTTGRPKGVMVEHGSLARVLLGCVETFGWTGSDRMISAAPFSFDIFLFELLCPLLAGGSCELVPLRPALDLDRLMAALSGATRFHAVPALMRQVAGLARREGGAERFRGLSTLFVGGDAVPLDLLAEMRRAFPAADIRVLYGPTEGTIVGSSFAVPAGENPAVPPRPLGRPLPGAILSVRDPEGNLVPAGLPGELWIGGAGVTRGYLGREELTRERYVVRHGERFFKTGDGARWLPDGNLQFLGRLDRQVKVRGFRIEPEEIEAALREHPAVHEAAVGALEAPGGDKRLVAWVASGPGEPPAEEELYAALAARLPEFMVPGRIVFLKALPLTAHGKVDRRALERLEVPASSGGLEGPAAPPRTPVEETLSRVWRSVLRLDRVGVHDDFFRSGGDSILSLQIVVRAREEGLHVTPKQIFENPTIATLAAVATPLGERIEEDGGPAEGEAPLTPIQRFFLKQEGPEPHWFNQALLLEIRQRTEPQILARATAALLAAHGALRLRFRREDGEWRSAVAPAGGEAPFLNVDLSALPAEVRSRAVEAASAELQTGFDLARGPLFLAALFDPGRLLLAAHHLVVDAVSWRVLLEDLETACRQIEAGELVRLPAPTLSWRRWAERLAEHARSTGVRDELPFWLDAPAAVPLPLDRPGGENTAGAIASVPVSLSPAATASLLREAPRAYNTRVDDLLLTALAVAFARWTGEPRLRLDLEAHGREEIAPGVDLSRTVGWFTAVYPVTLDLAGTGGPGEAILAIKEQLRAVPRRGIGCGLLRWLGDGEARERLASLPEPEVAFNNLGQLDSALGEEEERFAPAPESAGPSQSPRARRSHLIEVNALVLDGRLRVDWNYSAGLHAKATIERLAGDFRDVLEDLIAHCLSPEAGGFSPSDFPLARLDRATLEAALGADRSVEDLYPLAPLQKGMLLHGIWRPESPLYLEQLHCDLVGDLDVSAFTRAWQRVVDRHPNLRTAFLWRGLPEPLQAVRREVELPWALEDFRGLPDADGQARAWIAEDAARVFDLSRPPLLRAALLQTGEDRHRFVWSFHHLLFDGWCFALLFREVFTFYQAFRRGEDVRLPEPRPYRDYIAWLAERDPAAAEAYWRAALAGFAAPTPLPLDAPGAPAPAVPASTEWERRLSPGLTAALEAFAQGRRLTLNTLVQAAWGLLLARMSGERDVVFGAVVSGRPPELPGVESMIGLFINSLPVRVDVDWEAPTAAWLRAVQEDQVEMRQHEWSPLADVQGWSGLPPGEPLFHSLLAFENYPVDDSLGEGAGDLTVRNLVFFDRADYPLSLVVIPGSGSGLSLRLLHDHRTEGATALRLLGHLETLLAGLAGAPDRPLGDVPFLTEPERGQLLAWSSGEEVRPEVAGCLHELFEAQAQRTPDAVALVDDRGETTYGELDRRANRLANALRGLGVGPEVRVGLSVSRNAEMVTAILGILKAGGAYVPVDPETPPDRRAFLLEDVPVVITEPFLDDPSWLAASDARPDPGVTPENLAYVIYTSGSTGLPKGVMVRHGSAAAYARAMAAVYGIGPGDRALQFASVSFDASIEEIFTALGAGATLFIRTVVDDVATFLARCRDWRLTHLSLPTAYWHQVAAALEGEGLDLHPELRFVVMGGERALPERWAAWGRGPGARVRLVNAYGPTEATIGATIHEHPGTADALPRREVPIGWPLPGVTAYVLGRDFRLVPVSALGELCLGGGCLARGYLDRPDLTAEKFVPDSLGEPGARLYRTGDLVRRLPDGTLEFAGRADSQVKIRGFRIELGEIEAALSAHPGVKEAVATTREDASGSRRLVAFAVPLAPGDPLADLRAFLAGRLPAYMVPSGLGVLDALPVTSAGKLDRRTLDAIEVSRDAGAGYVAPRNPIEETLAALWSELLGVDRVGVHDDFFTLGGHSLLATQLVSRVRRQLGVDLPLHRLFELRTLGDLAREVLARTLEGEGSGLDALMADLDGLSDEEALALLKEEGA